MSVQFVLGRAGSGKSEYIYRKILEEAAQAPAKNFFLFVPEQYTLTAQLKLLELSETKALFNVEALSFTRFARRVFNELGTGTLDVLEDTGKSLLISKILDEKNDSLSTLKNALTNQGGVEELKSLFSEFYQYGVKSEDLRRVFESDAVDPFFKKKVDDIITLFDAFQEEISGRFFTAEEIPALLCNVIDSSLLVKNSEFFFDGYTGFTPVQYDVLEKMMKLSGKLTFSFTYGERPAGIDAESNAQAAETDLFYMSEQSMASITKLCEFTGTTILPDIVMPSPAGRRFKEGSRLLWLEENFGLSTAKPFTIPSRCQAPCQNCEQETAQSSEFPDNPCTSDLSISLLSDPRDEIEFVCSEISRLIRTGRYHYRDFAILAAGTADYEDDAPRIFEKYGIPYFMDSNVSIFFHPFLEFIESALRIVRYGFKSEDVINFMRTGLTGFDEDEIDFFDDYLFSSGYKGKKAYLNDFTLLPDGFSDEDLVQINELRKRLMSEGFSLFLAEMTKKNLTYRSAATAIYHLFTYYDIEKKLYEKHIEFSEADDQIHAREYEEIFPKVIEVLDRMVRLLGDSTCTVDKFSDDLMMLLSAINVGVLPYSNDCVVFGDMERSRLSEIRILFLVGCHDGNIPGSFGNGGLFSESEREKLSTLDFHLAPTAREKAFIKKFYLYLALTRSSETLYISFTKRDKAGNSVLPSYLILDILKLFPDLSVNDIQKNARDRIYSVETLKPYLAADLREYALMSSQDEDKADSGQASGENSGETSCENSGKRPAEFDEMFALISVLKNQSSDKKQADYAYGNDEGTDSTLASFLSAAFYDGAFRSISTSLLSETHRDEETGIPTVYGSISNIESYYTCPYQYFLKYELGLKEKEEYGFRSLDIGNIYHHVLQKYSDLASKKYKDITTVPDDEMEAILKYCIDTEMKEISGRFLFASASESHIIDNVKDTIIRTVKELTKQLKRGIYRPRAFEYQFKNNILIPAPSVNGSPAIASPLGRLVLNGKIDRIDTGVSRTGDSIFVRVIDYKTGDKKLSEENVKSGLELQLFTYLRAAMEKAEKEEERFSVKSGNAKRQIIPGGLYFSHVENPVLKADDMGSDGILIGQDSYEDAVLKSYKLNGMMLNDLDNAHATDNDIFAGTDSFTFSPVTGFTPTKSMESLDKRRGNVKDLDYIESLMETVKEEESDAAGKILTGHFEKFPYIKRTDDNTKTDNTGCRYCAYHDVCLFDPALKGNMYRNIKSEDK